MRGVRQIIKIVIVLILVDFVSVAKSLVLVDFVVVGPQLFRRAGFSFLELVCLAVFGAAARFPTLCLASFGVAKMGGRMNRVCVYTWVGGWTPNFRTPFCSVWLFTCDI